MTRSFALPMTELFTTTLTDWDGQAHTVPNSAITSNTITNYTVGVSPLAYRISPLSCAPEVSALFSTNHSLSNMLLEQP